MKNILEYIGIDPRRVKLAWVSASEGQKFADVITDITRDVLEIGPMVQIARRDDW